MYCVIKVDLYAGTASIACTGLHLVEANMIADMRNGIRCECEQQELPYKLHHHRRSKIRYYVAHKHNVQEYINSLFK